ncbi:MAG TPA: hypothetical protein VGJ81_18175 [Thermoanaerobaculia bacterium]|jgi:hypothetical protein
MKNKRVFERVAALLNETIDVLLQGEQAPDSPLDTVTTGAQQRVYRRHAERLRAGEADTVFKNIWTREQFATVLENTVGRDKIRRQTRESFFRLGRKIFACMEEDPAEARRAFDWVFAETFRLAKEHGPDSEEAARWRQLQFIVRFAKITKEDHRGKRSSAPPAARQLAQDPSMSVPLIPAEVLDEAPEGEEIVPIPAEEDGGERMFIRIGSGASSWVGSFVCGLMPATTIFIMPDGEHLFVSACGAGYMIHLKSRTLVERLGTEIVGVHRDALMTFFLIEHVATLEAFGVATRLWKTEPLGAGGLRILGLTDDEVVGEALQASGKWSEFAVRVTTGEVSYGSSP